MTSYITGTVGTSYVGTIAAPPDYGAQAIVSPSGSVAALAASQAARQYVRVYVRATWDAAWTYVPYLQAIEVSGKSMPDSSRARFVYHIGEIKRDDELAYNIALAIERQDHYVCVRVLEDNLGEYTLWCGYLPAETVNIGGNRTATSGEIASVGDQELTAYGMEYVLDRRRVGGTYIGGDYLGQIGTFLETTIDFNSRGERGTIRGNRSYQAISFYSGAVNTYHAFAPSRSLVDPATSQPYVWSWRKVIEYMLEASDNFQATEREPHFRLTGTYGPLGISNGVLDYLDSRVSVVPHGKRSAWGVIKQLIAPSAMLSASFRFNLDGLGFPTGDVDLNVFSLSPQATHVGSAKFPANTTGPVWINVDSEPGIVASRLQVDSLDTYDTIIVEGAPVQSCASFCTNSAGGAYRTTAPRIAPAWTEDQQAGYDAADEKARRTSPYERVYRAFKIRTEAPGAFDFTAGSFVLAPAFAADGTSTGAVADYIDGPRKMLPTLPFYEAADADEDLQRFARPFAVMSVLDADGVSSGLTGRHVLSHRPGLDDNDTAYPSGAQLSPQHGDVLFDLHFNPQHAAAKNHMDGAAEVQVEPRFDFEKMLVTVAVEADVRPSVTWLTPRIGPGSRTLLIQVPDAHYWLVAPSTVVGLNEDGTLLTQTEVGPSLVRDDTDRLRLIASVVSSFAGRKRSNLSCTWAGIKPDYPLGTMVEGILTQSRGAEFVLAAVSSRTWRFEQGGFTTTLETRHIDPTRLSL